MVFIPKHRKTPQNRYRCSTRVLTRHIAPATCPGYRYTSTEHEVLNCAIVRCVEVPSGFPPKLRIRHPKGNGWLSKPQGSDYILEPSGFVQARRSFRIRWIEGPYFSTVL